MPSEPVDLESVVDRLVADPVAPGTVQAIAPAEPGLYAWWGPPDILPDLVGLAHPARPDLRLLYIGLTTTKLRTRLGTNHLRRSGSSTLRRALAGLLLDEQRYRTRRTDRVVLIDEDEVRLTEWMTTHLLVSWCTHPSPADVEKHVIKLLRPPMNIKHASGPALHLVKEARRRYNASAGARP
ncbi:GIY-YIG nuclease family protein [Pseudonocardia alni]|uniref:GIY-YIG nuclease family protein n=1 Tax=Pseudonocardia alni TaxID=33907 RepID=UPI001AD6AFB1|nr:hypothetical protein [Pseudonocardia alni]MBO4239345.1 GIY-YIG nuclease family protein [Pseudonocardia alni]